MELCSPAKPDIYLMQYGTHNAELQPPENWQTHKLTATKATDSTNEKRHNRNKKQKGAMEALPFENKFPVFRKQQSPQKMKAGQALELMGLISEQKRAEATTPMWSASSPTA